MGKQNKRPTKANQKTTDFTAFNLSKVPKSKNAFISDSEVTGLDSLVGKPIKGGSLGLGYKAGSTNFMNTGEYTPYIDKVNRGASPFAFGSDYEKSRAMAQSGGEQAWNVAKRILPNIGLEFLNQLGGAVDVEDYIQTDQEVGNWLSNWAQEKKAEMNEANPVYRVNPEESLDIGDSGWWFENGSSLIESATAFVGLGYLTGGASLRGLTKGAQALEWLGALGKGTTMADKGQKLIRTGAGLTNAMMLNQAEGVGVATQVYSTAYEKAIKDLQREGDLTTEEIDVKAKTIASERAASALNFNKINILLNLTSATAFLRAPKLTRELLTAPSVRRSAKMAGVEALQEAGEESINLLAEKQALADIYTFNDAAKDVTSKEGIEAAILGAVGGAGQTAITNAGRGLKTKKNDKGERYSRNDEQRANFAEQQEVLTRWESLSKSEKFSENTDAYMRSEETFELYKELNNAIENEDVVKTNELRNKLISVQAYDAFSSGTTEQLLGVFKGVKEMTPEQAEEKGLDVKTYVQDSDNAIKYIETLEKEYAKSKQYLNFDKVYDNRAETIANKERQANIETILQDAQTQLTQDLADIGIEEDSYEFDKYGNFKFTGKAKYAEGKQTAVNDLNSLEHYKIIKGELKKNKDKTSRLIKRHTKLTSKKEQQAINKQYEKQREEIRKGKAEAKIQEQQTKNSAKNKAQTTKHKTAVKAEAKKVVTEVEETETKEESTTKATKDTSTEGYFKLTNEESTDETIAFEKQMNDMMASDKYTNAQKIQVLNNAINVIPENVKEASAGNIAQYNRAIRELTIEQEIKDKDAETKTTAEKNAEERARDLSESFSPVVSRKEDGLNAEEEKLIKKKRLLVDTVKLMEEAKLDTSTFTSIAKFMQRSIGRDKFVRIFDDFKDLYNLTKINAERATESYDDVFLENDEKLEIVNSDKIVDANILMDEFYNLSDIEFDALKTEEIKAFIESQGYKVHKGEDAYAEGTKVILGHNKIAWLAKEYKTEVKTYGTSKFNVLNFVTSKSDIDRTINASADEALLDFTQIKEGSKITLVPLEVETYDDGTIVYADGRVVKDGVTTQQSPIDVAPIGILYNGRVLKGAYLHTTEWINQDNIANPKDVKTQKRYLTKIRQTVIAAGTKGIETTVRKRTDGHLLRDVEGKEGKVSTRLPNAELAIGKDNAYFTNKKNTIEVINKGSMDAMVYTVVPVNNGRKVAIPARRSRLGSTPEYVESVINAVRLYVEGNTNDPRTKALFNESGIDITTMTGLRNYISKFVYTNPNMKEDIGWDNFKNFVDNLDEDVSIVRVSSNNIEFGRGMNVGGTIGFINKKILNDLARAEGQGAKDSLFSNLLDSLKNTLQNNTYINIDKNKFGTKFTLPIITNTGVKTNKINYDDFVKDNLTTDLYSHTLDNGKEIYTVQSNLEYDTTFAFREDSVTTVTSEGIKSVPDTPPVVDNEISLNHGGQDFSFDPTKDWGEDLSPNVQYQKTANNPEEQAVSEKTIRDLASRLAHRIGIRVEFENKPDEAYKGKFNRKTYTATINLAHATLDTPVHEIMAHPIIRALKNIGNTSEDIDAHNEFMAEYWDANPNKTRNEVIEYVEANYKPLKTNQLYQNLLKELETGIGKEVFDRIKNDYQQETITPEQKEGYAVTMEEEIEVLNRIAKENPSDPSYTAEQQRNRINSGVIGDTFIVDESTDSFKHNYVFKDGTSVDITYVNTEAHTSIARIDKIIVTPAVVKKYTIEEQQEEAIVELLGLYTANKLDAIKDKGLITKIKEFFKEVSNVVRKLLGQRDIDVKDLPNEMTLSQLSEILAYGNSHIILPGNEVRYTTPDNETFSSYPEASNHISKMIQESEDVDLDKITLEDISDKAKEKIAIKEKAIEAVRAYIESKEYKDLKQLEIESIEDDIERIKGEANTEYQYTGIHLMLDDHEYNRVQHTEDPLRKGQNVEELKGHKGYYIYSYSTSVDLNGLRRETTITPITEEQAAEYWDKSGETVPQEVARKVHQATQLLEAVKTDASELAKISQIEQEIYRLNYSPINAFIEKDAEYAESKRILTEWKKANNIKYNPEEVYSRGEGFYSVVGAYANFDVKLLFQNLIRHIEDNNTVGEDYTISAYTESTRKDRHALDKADKSNIRIEIFPKSEDIKWAAKGDVYSGSVWDAWSTSQDKIVDDVSGKALMGVAYSKYPGSTSVYKVSPNLTEVVQEKQTYNELGVALTTTNFRVSYEENVPESLKAIIDNVNKLLTDKYGEVAKPAEVKEDINKPVIKFDYKTFKGSFNLNGIDEHYYDVKKGLFGKIHVTKKYRDNRADEKITTEEALADIKAASVRHGSKIDHATPGLVFVEGLVNPTVWKNSLKESIRDTKERLNKVVKQWVAIDNTNGAIVASGTMEEINATLAQWEGYTDYKLEETSNKIIENTKPISKALANRKVIALKEANKKYPRSLIRSEVVKTGEFHDAPSMDDFVVEIDDLPFQKVPSLAPKKMSDTQSKEYEYTIPTSLFVAEVPINVQDGIVNTLSANVLKALEKDEKKDTNEALKVIPEFKNFLRNVGVKITQEIEKSTDKNAIKNMTKYLDTVQKVIKEYDKITLLTVSNLQQNNNVIKKGKGFSKLTTDLEDEVIDFEEYLNAVGDKDNAKWSDDSAFTVDTKLKISTKVKNAFSYIEDASGTKIINDKKVGIPKVGFVGTRATVPFDQVINEVTALLAYSNHKAKDVALSAPTFESMVDALTEFIDAKPYLVNVIDKMNTLDEQTRNQFVSVMSRHYTHHTYIFKNKKGNLFMNSSDSNNVIGVVQENWISNIMDNDLIITKDGEYIYNESAIDKVIADSNALMALLRTPNLDADSPVILAQATKVFDGLGFNFTPDIVKKLATEGITYGNKDYSLLTLLNDSDGAFKVYVNRLNNLKGKDYQNNHPFEDNSALTNFSRSLGKLYPMYFASSFKDVRKRNYFSYSNNKFLVDRVKKLKEDTTLIDKIVKQPFAMNSYWAKQLKHNDDFRNFFGYFAVDGLSEENVENGKKMQTMSPAELEQLKLGFFYAQNGKEVNTDFVNYRINLFYPTTSNKDVQYGIKTMGMNFGTQVSPNTGELTDGALDILFGLVVVPEINRILSIQANPTRYNIKGYKEGGSMFNMIPSLNNVNSIWVEEDGFRKLNTNVLTDPNMKQSIKITIKDFVDTLVDKKLQTWETYGFIEKEIIEDFDPVNNIMVEYTTSKLKQARTRAADIGVHSARKEAYNVVANYLVANTNIYQLFTTDPAFYWKSKQWKTVANRETRANAIGESISTREQALKYYTNDDYVQEHEDLFNHMGKRLAADVAPGTDRPNSPNNTFTLGHLADIDKNLYLLDYYKGLLDNNAKDYFNPAGTDAQEFTTLAEHVNDLVEFGTITRELANKILAKDKAGEDLDEAEMKGVLNPRKPVYVNNIWTDGIEHRLYVKSSSFPLFKQLTRGLEIDKLRVAMENQKVDRVAFDSAIKIGGLTEGTKVFKGDKESATGAIEDNIEIKVIGRSIPREGFKIQQEMPFDENKVTINDGTQQRKLLTSAVRHVQGFKIGTTSDTSYSGQDIQDELDVAYDSLFRLKYDALVKELSFNIEDGTINMQALQKVLKEEALTRNYPLYDLEALNLTLDNNGQETFVVPLWLTGVAPKIEAMLNSIVDNRVRKVKPKGKSFILGTSEGFKPIIEGKDAKKTIATTKGIVFDKDWADRTDGELLPMRIEDDKGRVKGDRGFNSKTAIVKPAEIMVSFKFKDDKGKSLKLADFTKEDGTIDSEKLSPEVLKLFAFRIPTQGLNSMASVKIVGFLPDSSGDLLLAPSDWTVQMGSDFDIDKVYTNSYNTSYIDKKLTRFTTAHKKNRKGLDDPKDTAKHLENTILDLHFSILENTDEEVQSEITRPLDFGNLPSLISEIYPYVDKATEGIGITEQYQTQKYLNARAGKGGIGVFSTDSTFIAVSQNKDLYLRKFNGKDWFPYVRKLGGVTSNKISNPSTVEDNSRTKTQVIAAFQSLAVDDENEQGMFKLNVNTHTFAAIRTMAMIGFEENIITYLLNQPIIREYVKLKTLADDSVTSYTEEDIKTDIKKTYFMSDPSMPVNEFFSTFGNPSKEQMLDMIQSPNPNKDVQIALLSRFLEFTEFGEQIQSVQSAINSDSAGLGKDLFYSTTKEQQLLGLPYRDFMANAENLIGKYLTIIPGQGDPFNAAEHTKHDSDVQVLIERWYTTPLSQEEKREVIDELQSLDYIPVSNVAEGGEIADNITFIKPETINGFASVYGLMLNNRVWKQFFPYRHEIVTETIKDIKQLTKKDGRNLVEESEINRQVFSGVKSFLATTASDTYVDGDLLTERKRLIMDTKDNKSIASIVKSLYDSNKLDNPFISRLKYNINKDILPSTVIYKANIAENLNERSVYAAVSNMLLDDTTDLGEFNEIRYTPKKIMQDLIAQQLISGGVQKATQFIKYIPINYLSAVGYYDYMRGLKFENETHFNKEGFILQNIQHNPKTVEYKATTFLEKDYEYKNDKTIIRKANSDAKNLRMLFSIKEDNTKGYRLYRFNGDSGQWHQIDVLGNKDVLEYNSETNVGKSIIPSNQVPKVKTVTTPTTPTEKKKALTINTSIIEDAEVIYDPISADITETYNLDSTETSEKKMSRILETIINNTNNAFNKLMAEELHKNLPRLKEFRFMVSPTLNAQGSFNLKDNTIKINPNHIKDNAEFEEVFLEEVIHAFTKDAIVNNVNGEVLRLKGLRSLAEEVVRGHLGAGATQKFNQIKRKLKDGIALNADEAEIIYPVLDDTEFVGRLFKSKRLQQLLNDTPTDIEGVSMLDKFFDFIANILKGIGIDIKKDSALEYALRDIISLINQPPPSSNINREIKEKEKVIRTPEFIIARFDLQDENGNNRELDNAQEIADMINDTVSNLQANVVNNKIILKNKYKDYLETEVIKEGQQTLFDISFKGIKIDKSMPFSKLKQLDVYSHLGVNTMRKAGNEHFGNPFTGTETVARRNPNLILVDSVDEAVSLYKEWLQNGHITYEDIHGVARDYDGNNKQREWILNQIDEGKLDNVTLLYMNDRTGYKSHADALKEIVEDRRMTSFAPTKERTSALAGPLLKNINNRIDRLNLNIEKAEARGDFKKAEETREVLKNLIERLEGEDSEDSKSVTSLTKLADMAIKGDQDMQELTEMFNRKVTLEDALYIRKVISFWSSATANDVIFTVDARKSEKLMAKFKDIEAKAEAFDDKLTLIETNHTENFMKKYGVMTSIKDIFGYFKDINKMGSLFVDISRIGNGLLDSIFLSVKDANIDALEDSRNILSGLQELETKVNPILRNINSKEPYDIFRQKTDKGNLTGHLVSRYSPKFHKDKRNREKAVYDSNSFGNYINYLDWARDNTKYINLSYLLPNTPFTDKEDKLAKKYRADLKAELGDKHYAELIVEQVKLLKKYEARKDGKIEQLLEKYDLNNAEDIKSHPAATKNYNNWYYVNSPYAYYDQLKTENYTGLETFNGFTSFRYAHQIPSDDSQYDKDYKTIEDNKDLKEFYDYYVKVDEELKQWLSEEDRVKLMFDGIPFIQKNLLDQYKDKGMKAGLAPIWDGIKTSVRSTMEGDTTRQIIDPVTEVVEQRLGVNLSVSNGKAYSSFMLSKEIEYKLEHGTEPSNALRSEWGEEIINKLAQQKSYDLPKVLRIYALTVLAYKHKSRVEDNIRLAQTVLNTQEEYIRNAKGVVLRDTDTNVNLTHNKATSFVNTKAQFDYYIKTFYGKTKEDEGVTNTKVLTSEERQEKKNYENLIKEAKESFIRGEITDAERDNMVTTLQSQIDELGGVAVWSKRGDSLLKYVQLKSMGWNLMSAVANIGFGYISNRIEAAGGKRYTRAELRKAYAMTSHSLLKNNSFNTIETPTAKKIRAMMDKWDVLQTAKTELFQSPLDVDLGKKGKALAPYNLTERTEYLNQAPILIAMMLHKQVTKTDGTKSNMWEAFDNKGNWKAEYGEEPTADVKKLRMQVTQVNKMNHGNYDPDSPLAVKDTFGGRALSQFRTWMFEGVAARFETEKPDSLLGVRKGRYRSVVDYFNKVGGANALAEIGKSLIRDITMERAFKDADFERDVDNKTFKEVDAENMRKVMSEMLLYTEIMVSYFLLSMAVADLDDEDPKKYLLNSLINQSIRLKTDILFYLNPAEFRNLLRDLIPAASVIKDFQELGSAAYKFGVGEDEIKTGVYSGHSRLLRESAQALPFGTQIYKTVNYGVQTFD